MPYFFDDSGSGIGLGLATSRNLVEKDGGTLTFEKAGKQFLIQLPVLKAQTQVDPNTVTKIAS